MDTPSSESLPRNHWIVKILHIYIYTYIYVYVYIYTHIYVVNHRWCLRCTSMPRTHPGPNAPTLWDAPADFFALATKRRVPLSPGAPLFLAGGLTKTPGWMDYTWMIYWIHDSLNNGWIINGFWLVIRFINVYMHIYIIEDEWIKVTTGFLMYYSWICLLYCRL